MTFIDRWNDSQSPGKKVSFNGANIDTKLRRSTDSFHQHLESFCFLRFRKQPQKPNLAQQWQKELRKEVAVTTVVSYLEDRSTQLKFLKKLCCSQT